MKSFLQSAVLFVAITLNSAAINKISNTVIQNGTKTYSVSDSPNVFFMLYINKINPTDFPITLMRTDQPKWATLHAVDATPDINVIGEDLVRVYFTGFSTLQELTRIGVAVYNCLSPMDCASYYLPLGEPLELPGALYNLTDPSLSQSSSGNEVPVLFYSNHTHIYQVDMDRGLFYTGHYTVLPPSLEWEGGAMRSPRALEHNGEYYVLYTAADGVTVGALRSQHHGGPYQKNPRPVGVLRDARNNIRTMHKDNINWAEDGWPYL